MELVITLRTKQTCLAAKHGRTSTFVCRVENQLVVRECATRRRRARGWPKLCFVCVRVCMCAQLRGHICVRLRVSRVAQCKKERKKKYWQELT